MLTANKRRIQILPNNSSIINQHNISEDFMSIKILTFYNKHQAVLQRHVILTKNPHFKKPDAIS